MIELYEWNADRTDYSARPWRDIYRDISRSLEAAGFKDDIEYLATACGMKYEGKKIPKEYRFMACYAVTGGSEGHYVHIEMILGEGKVFWLFFVKTFSGMDKALEMAAFLTKELGA